MVKYICAISCVCCLSANAMAMTMDPASVSGTIVLEVGNGGFAPRTVQTYPIVFPESENRTLSSGYTGALAQVDHTLAMIGDSAMFDFYSKDAVGTGNPDDIDGRVRVDMSFTTSSDTWFTFTAIDPYSPDSGIYNFSSQFNDILAVKYFDRDAPGGVNGTFPTGPCPPCNPPSDTFTTSGFLPAGTYSLSLQQGGSYRGYEATHDSRVTLELNPIPEFNTLMLAAMSLGSLAMWRRRHVA